MDSVHKTRARYLHTNTRTLDREIEREKHDVHVLLSAFVRVLPLVVKVVVVEEYKVFFLLLLEY
jgi:hypothetical protein